jgi:hypothetical protein
MLLFFLQSSELFVFYVHVIEENNFFLFKLYEKLCDELLTSTRRGNNLIFIVSFSFEKVGLKHG